MFFLKAKRPFGFLCCSFPRSEKKMGEKKKEKMLQQAKHHQWVPQEAVLMSYSDGRERRALVCKCTDCTASEAPLCTT